MKLTRADELHLREAEGWLGLGDHVSAFEALERVDGQLRTHPDILKIRWRIYAQAGKWGNAFSVAEGLTRVLPDHAEAFIWRSYSARRMQGGTVSAAFDLLRDVAGDFPDEPLVAFNLACYSCQLGRNKESRDWLQRAFDAGEKSGQKGYFRKLAAEEPDLEPLRKEGGI